MHALIGLINLTWPVVGPTLCVVAVLAIVQTIAKIMKGERDR